MQKILFTGVILCWSIVVCGQQITPSDFGKLSRTWSEVGNVTLNPLSDKADVSDGTGILLNLPGKKAGEDIKTTESYGDFDLSFEYMMFPGSNSGVYLQGNYEIQLFDSWRRTDVTSADNGGVYKRFEGERALDGHAPRQNASRAPGLWQKMEISFQAPRFNGNGVKTENARLLKVVLNGVLIHEDIELFAPTAGALSEEVARGPIRIQGDHGAVAFRNMEITTFDRPVPALDDVTYSVYEGTFTSEPDLSTLTPIAQGEASVLTPGVSPRPNGYLIHYKGTLRVSADGEYNLSGGFNGGGGVVVIDGTPVIGPTEWRGNGSVTLSAGEHALELYYSKFYEWASAGLALTINGPGIRDVSFHDDNVNMVTAVDPIYLEAPTILRSFMDIPDHARITRAVSVGSARQIHYTYDMDHGSVVHGWRGEFIDATPMWLDRGDGSSRPRGAITMLDGVDLVLRSADDLTTSSDTTGTGFTPKGYTLQPDQTPGFRYEILGYSVTDEIRVLPDASGFGRKISVTDSNNLKLLLGSGESVEKVDDGLFRVDGRYYIKVNAATEPTLVNGEGQTGLWIGIEDEISYEILF